MGFLMRAELRGKLTVEWQTTLKGNRKIKLNISNCCLQIKTPERLPETCQLVNTIIKDSSFLIFFLFLDRVYPLQSQK